MLAEVGAIAAGKGYQSKKTNDKHPLAWPRLLDSNGTEINQEEIDGSLQAGRPAFKEVPRTQEGNRWATLSEFRRLLLLAWTHG